MTEAATLQVESHKGIIFASFDTVKTCHQILNIGTSAGAYSAVRAAGEPSVSRLVRGERGVDCGF